jgi:hypothetical protein
VTQRSFEPDPALLAAKVAERYGREDWTTHR